MCGAWTPSEMPAVDLAVDLFGQGFNCAQAVFAPFSDNFDSALRIGAGFGGGIARQGGLCGAVAGAVMALGLRCGSAEVDAESKAALYATVRRLLTEFEETHGSLVCRELIECDLSTEEGWAEATRRNLHRTVCPAFVRTAAVLVERLLAEGQ